MAQGTYGYSARVADGAAASLLLVSAADHAAILRREVEREIHDTIHVLKSTKATPHHLHTTVDIQRPVKYIPISTLSRGGGGASGSKDGGGDAVM